MSFITNILFITSLLAMLTWFYQQHKSQNRNLASVVFLLSMAGYILGMFWSSVDFYAKLLVLIPRDIVLFLTTFLVANNAKSLKKFLLMGFVVLTTGYFFYTPHGQHRLLYFFSFGSCNYHSCGMDILEDLEKKGKLHKLAEDGEILIDIKDKTQVAQIREVLKLYNIKVTKAFPNIANEDITTLDDCYLLDIPKQEVDKVQEILQKLYNENLIDWAEENEVISLSPEEVRNDIGANDDIDFGINDPKVKELWGFKAMQMQAFYAFLRDNKIKPKKKTKIFILDTGVDGKHEDLKEHFFSTKPKYDIDKQTHGTHCAGIAASVTNNQTGIASFAPNQDFVQVTSIKVLNDYGWGTQDDIINGMIEASDKGADVISMSLGGPSNDRFQRAYEEAVRYANKKGAIVVVAAGNSNKDAKEYSPANCEGVICVSAINNKLEKASFSNYIQNVKMGIAAPGQDILSTLPNNKYGSYSGTSMATPYVAGLVAVLRAVNPKLNTQTAYNILKSTGKTSINDIATGKIIQPLPALQKTLK